MTRTTGAPAWLALRTSNPDGSLRFYSGLFGWTAEHTGSPIDGDEVSDNVNFALGDALVASMDGNPSENGSAWTVFLESPDVNATATAALAAGGTVVYSARLGDVGSMLSLIDPTGAEVGAWQPGTHSGFGVDGGPGAPVWHELNTKDFGAARDFYERAFEWTTTVLADSDEFRYATFGDEATAVAGIHDSAAELGADERSHWISYFEVADSPSAIARVTELGGTVLSPTFDSPHGKVTVVSDPFGARFVIMEPPAR